MISIYNEEIEDLFSGHKRQLHESIEKGVCIRGLTSKYVSEVDEMIQVWKNGLKNMYTGITDMGKISSRNNTILTITIE